MYLLRTAIADVEAGTYHGSCGLKTIATSKPVRTAPLGNSHAVRFHLTISASVTAATITALARPGAIWLTPSPGAASGSRRALSKESKSYLTRTLAYLEVLREGMRDHLATFQAYPPKKVMGLGAEGRARPSA